MDASHIVYDTVTPVFVHTLHHLPYAIHEITLIAKMEQ